MRSLARNYFITAAIILYSLSLAESQNIKNVTGPGLNGLSGFHQILSKQPVFSHSAFNELLQTHVSEDGRVDYLGFKSSRQQLSAYISLLGKDNSKLGTASKEEQLAYWINAYNALTIDLVLRHYPLKSIKDIKKPWDQKLWQFGDDRLSLNEIEHKILRKMGEPRIHFAIVCASVSCPKLQNSAFTADKLELQLERATRAFLNDTSKNKISENRLELSKIFKWFAKDFKTNGSLIDFLNRYTDISIAANAKTAFMDYNWDLNE